MLLAEQALLLALDDKGQFRTAVPGWLAGAALLIELRLAEMIEVSNPEAAPSGQRISLLDRTRSADPVLGASAVAIGEKSRTAMDLMSRLGRHRAALMDRLVAAGHVTHDDAKVLGLIPNPRWPAADTTERDRLVAEIRGVLGDGAAASEGSAALISLLNAVGVLRPLTRFAHVSDREIARRAAALGEQQPFAAALAQLLTLAGDGGAAAAGAAAAV